MDSITQITLGAAVGEALLGRKIGNRAMMWGAIGGTIPDLDIIANFFLNDVDALAFHRGPTHSIAFSILAAIPIAWLVYRLYNRGIYERSWYKGGVSALGILFLWLIVFAINSLFGFRSIGALVLTVLPVGFFTWRIVKNHATKEPLEKVDATYQQWYILFFLAFFTHILLDCFTAFGTQMFLPFSDYRVAFSTIAVADPMYTVPFILCVAVAAFFPKNNRWRSMINWVGIAISSVYLVFTVFNKQRVNHVFEKALDLREMQVNRFHTGPTILNNMLWNCIAEDDDAYYQGLYSIFDTNPRLHQLNVIKKDKELLSEISDFPEIQTLHWFSDGFLRAERLDADSLVLSDLRYASFTDTVKSYKDYIFNFHIKKGPNGIEVRESRDRPTDDDDVGEQFRVFVERIKGY